ncbi:hypothetical protein Mycsm_06741 (plasmid) [Mycobacterium sp. JS623]|uniref:hypothetical protein n=1 Tax=Mycobacterium sp. JS623 TaxID=212767 RepID=UPI0002A58571|nr:hypothetical protein [Mycobacterium sp. JS623]AGB26857.1 hypothetical protein Mycsm_06741 [Mycobacterium sp. JS623]
MSALVAQVNQALHRGHAMFGDPLPAGRPERAGFGAARDALREDPTQVAALSGQWASRYRDFAASAGEALDAAAGTDTALLGQVQAAADADRAGHAGSGAALTGAASDTAALATVSGTPAGQRAMLAALRARLAQQHRVISAYTLRDARLAAALRALAYRSNATPGRPATGVVAAGGAGPLSSVLGRAGGEAFQPMLVGSLEPAVFTQRAGDRSRVGSLGTPLGALTRESSPREVAAAIIHEAWRRGYTPQQTIAILSCAMQESGLNPKAVSPNRLWRSIFQQDASYAGRDNPNLAIAAFFDRLDRHGGPSSPDIWKSIFWLQQRPGDPSAQAAYAHGRRDYLTEIMSQQGHAAQVYRSIAGDTEA